MKLIYIISIGFLFQGVVTVWYEPMLSQCGLLVAFTGLCGFFIGVWSITLLVLSSVHGLFIFIKCMVQHLQYFLSLVSQPFPLMKHLRFRCICWASAFLRIPGALAWCILGVPWSQFYQIQQICIFSRGSALLSMGILQYACLACP